MAKKKISIAYLVCAGRIIQDKLTFKYSYIDVFDLVRIPKEGQITYQSFFVGGKLLGFTAGKYKITLKVMDPDGNEIGSSPFPETDLVDGDVPLNALFPIIPISKLGRHIIKVFVNEKEIEDEKRYYFDVQLLEIPK